MMPLRKTGVALALTAFSGDIEKTDAEQYNAFTRELAKIEGYPLSIKLEWFQNNQACQAQRRPRKASEIDMNNGLEGAALSMVGNFLKDQKDKIVAEWQKDARVRYIYEVTSVSEEMIKDSTFEVGRNTLCPRRTNTLPRQAASWAPSFSSPRGDCRGLPCGWPASSPPPHHGLSVSALRIS